MGLFRKTKFDLGEWQQIDHIVMVARSTPKVLSESKASRENLSNTVALLEKTPAKVSKQAWHELIRTILIFEQKGSLCNSSVNKEYIESAIRSCSSIKKSLLKVYENVVENPSTIEEIMDSTLLFELTEKEKKNKEELDEKAENERLKRIEKLIKDRQKRIKADSKKVTGDDLLCRALWFYREYLTLAELGEDRLIALHNLYMSKFEVDFPMYAVMYKNVNKFVRHLHSLRMEINKYPCPDKQIIEIGYTFKDRMNTYVKQPNSNTLKEMVTSFNKFYSTVITNWESAPGEDVYKGISDEDLIKLGRKR